MFLPDRKPASPVLDLITGLGQIFIRPMGTPPTFPPNNSSGGNWGTDLPDYGTQPIGNIFKPMVIEENPQPKPRLEYDIWGNPIERYPMDERPSPGFRTMEKRDYDVFSQPWRDDTEQQDWLKRWDIQPANDARYLPTFPDPNDTSTGAAIRRNWHNSYKDFAKNTIGQHAPMFAEKMPQPQPQQSYGDFMGEIKNTASTLVNSAASQLGGGLGNALSFIPGLGPIMELIGQVANIGSTVAGATGLGGEKAGSILNLVGSIANGAAGGAATNTSAAGAEEFGPPSPNGFGETSPSTQNTEGGMFSGLRPNQPQSTTTPANPPFKPQPTPATSDGEGSWFKPLDQMFKEIDERQARGETFDEKNNVWVKPATATGSASMPQEKRFGQAIGDPDSPWMQGDVGNIGQSLEDRAKYEINKYTPNVSVDEKGRLQTRYDYSLDDPKFKEDVRNIFADHEGVKNKPYVPKETIKDKNGDKVNIPNRNSGATIGIGSDMAQMWQKDIEKTARDYGYSEGVIADLKQFGKAADGTAGPKGVDAQKKVDEFLAKHPDFEMTPQQIDDLFDKRLREFTPAAENLRKQMQAQGKDLSPEQYAGALSAAYVKGSGGFQNSEAFKNYINNQPQAFKDNLKNDPSLVGKRADRIIELMIDKTGFNESLSVGSKYRQNAFDQYNGRLYPGMITNFSSPKPGSKNGKK